MHELQRELSEEYGLSVRVDKMFHQDEPAIEFVIRKETMRDFMYGIKSVGQDVSDQLINDGNLPHIRHQTTYKPYAYFSTGASGTMCSI